MWVARRLGRDKAEMRNARKPLRGLTLKRQRRRVSAPALIVNPWVAAFRHDRSTSGGWTRTSDLRVMSPTSCQLLYPAIARGTVAQPAPFVKTQSRVRGGGPYGRRMSRR